MHLEIPSFGNDIEKIDAYLKAHADKYFKANWKEDSIYEGIRSLEDSIRYSLLGNGKRFRPLLSILVAHSLEQPEERVLPLGIAVESIHTYSLIHDDLPSIDNDDERRGKPSNHKVYGEATALLAGDALQAQAFQHIAYAYKTEPEMALELIHLLSQAIGIHGMVGGQALDLRANKRGQQVKPLCQHSPNANKHNHSEKSLGTKKSLETKDSLSHSPTPKNYEESQLEAMYQLHRMKTGALIRFSIEGAAVACKATPKMRQNLSEFGDKLGLAFQLSDDILDFKGTEIPEPSGFPFLMGLEETRSLLNQVTEEAKDLLNLLGEKAKDFNSLVEWNARRTKEEGHE